MAVKKRLVRIAPMQLGKMSGALYGAMALIFVPIGGMIMLAGIFFPQQNNSSPISGLAISGIGVGLLIGVPLLYALMGFIIGVVGAAIYNLFARWIGGIEVEVE